MISDDKMRGKIKTFHRRRSKENVRYYANSYAKDHIIWRSLCALYVQERIEKDNKRYLTFQKMIWLLAMKQYVVESGKDKFWMGEIKRYLNFHFKQKKSQRYAVSVTKSLLKAGYIMETGLHKTEGYMLTMKARAFYRDLDELFQI